jgi:hypothetical protein
VKELAETLRSLQNYDSRSWREIKEGCSAPWLYSLIKQLDELSLIDELSDKRSDDEEILRCVADIIQTSVSFLLKRVSSRASVYVNQLDSIKSFLRQASDSMQVSMLFTAESWDHNFAMQGIAVQIAYAYRNLPEILPVWSRILSLSLEVLTGIKESKSVDPLSTENFNTTDLKTIETYALSFVHLVVLSGLRVSTRLTTIQEPVSAESLSGIAVAICGERVLSTAATKLGTPHYLVAIANHQANAISPLIQGIYVEQFHVTYRFVEIIGPLFAKRLKSELRSRIFNYFHEEYGHEHYELETCKALGLDPENVKRAIPLPMSTLYVDAYTGTSLRRVEWKGISLVDSG